MSMTYIHLQKKWPEFTWDQDQLTPLLERVHLKQGRLIGKMEGLGFDLRDEAVLQNLTEDVIKSSEIEGEKLDRNQVRSSIARRMGMDVAGLVRSDRDIEGVVEMMMDATHNYKQALSSKRLFDWHAALFPTGRSGMTKITIGNWRNDSDGPMRVVSGPVGREKIYFEAPKAKLLNNEMKLFLSWFNKKKSTDSILKAAVAHLWFVTIHPFDDGNGRITRAITDMLLARSEDSSKRFYSMSAQICIERNKYYAVLEKTQKGTLDITEWIIWFLNCMERSLQNSDKILSSVLKKAKFWEIHANQTFSERQRKLINRLLDGFEGNMTSSRWANIGKCSQDSAARDIQDLIKMKIIKKNQGGGRSTSYSLLDFKEEKL